MVVALGSRSVVSAPLLYFKLGRVSKVLVVVERDPGPGVSLEQSFSTLKSFFDAVGVQVVRIDIDSKEVGRAVEMLMQLLVENRPLVVDLTGESNLLALEFILAFWRLSNEGRAGIQIVMLDETGGTPRFVEISVGKTRRLEALRELLRNPVELEVLSYIEKQKEASFRQIMAHLRESGYSVSQVKLWRILRKLMGAGLVTRVSKGIYRYAQVAA